MEKLLEHKVKNAHSGYILIDNKSNLKHKIKKSTIPIIKNLEILKDFILSTTHIYLMPRNLMRFQGVLSWYKYNENIILYGIKTKKGINPRLTLKLYKEFESLSKKIGAEYMETCIINKDISSNFMERFNWEPFQDTDAPNIYRKKVK